MEVLALSVVEHVEDVLDMLFGRFVELLGAVLVRAFRQQVDDVATRVCDPVHALVMVDEAQDLNAVQVSGLLGKAADAGDSLFLTFRDTCRGHLEAVDVYFLQQQTCDHQLLMRQEADAVGLFAVAQRRVHDLDARLHLI